MRFYAGQLSQRGKSRIFCPVEAFDNVSGHVIVPKKMSPYATDISATKRKLDELREYVFAHFWREQYDARDGWLQETIDNFHKISMHEKHLTIREVCNERSLEKNLDGPTKIKYKTLLAALDRYAGRRTLYIDRFTEEDVEKFAKFYRNEGTRSINTEANKMKALRAIFTYAVDKGYCKVNPVAKYKIPTEVYGDPIFLTVQERDTLYQCELPEPLSTQRDIFIFQCYVGCRVGDLVRLTRSNVDGNWLVYVANKTRKSIPQTLRIPLSKVALDILEKYRCENRQALLPFIRPQKYNCDIHKAAKIAGLNRIVMVLNTQSFKIEPRQLWEVVSSHTARKTFMEWMFRETKSERITSAFTGHVPGSKAFSRYTHVDDDMKRQILEELESRKI